MIFFPHCGSNPSSNKPATTPVLPPSPGLLLTFTSWCLSRPTLCLKSVGFDTLCVLLFTPCWSTCRTRPPSFSACRKKNHRLQISRQTTSSTQDLCVEQTVLRVWGKGRVLYASNKKRTLNRIIDTLLLKQSLHLKQALSVKICPLGASAACQAPCCISTPPTPYPHPPENWPEIPVFLPLSLCRIGQCSAPLPLSQCLSQSIPGFSLSPSPNRLCQRKAVVWRFSSLQIWILSFPISNLQATKKGKLLCFWFKLEFFYHKIRLLCISLCFLMFFPVDDWLIDGRIDPSIIAAMWPKGKSTDASALPLTSCVTLSHVKVSELQVNEG